MDSEYRVCYDCEPRDCVVKVVWVKSKHNLSLGTRFERDWGAKKSIQGARSTKTELRYNYEKSQVYIVIVVRWDNKKENNKKDNKNGAQ